jgi:hypothetical protein
MFALSVGVQKIRNALSSPVYAHLWDLNASTVGIIALAAIQLADEAVENKIAEDYSMKSTLTQSFFQFCARVTQGCNTS